MEILILVAYLKVIRHYSFFAILVLRFYLF